MYKKMKLTAGYCSNLIALTASNLTIRKDTKPCTQKKSNDNVLIEITSWLVSAYDFYSRVVKDR